MNLHLPVGYIKVRSQCLWSCKVERGQSVSKAKCHADPKSRRPHHDNLHFPRHTDFHALAVADESIKDRVKPVVNVGTRKVIRGLLDNWL